MKKHYCRFCGTELREKFADLGAQPLANSYVKAADETVEEIYPLCAYVCENCFLVQVDEFVRPENIFSDYAYFSSYSSSWLTHAKKYVNDMTSRFSLDDKSYVVEVASNDGYLLQYFKEKNIPVLGIEPAENVAEVARKKGICTKTVFFGKKTANELSQHKKADLLIANNVLAHVPDINDFVGGFKVLLADEGVITLEFPHLLRMMENSEFDTIYHEHFSYLSFAVVIKVLKAQGLRVFDVEELFTHGGSLRVFACHEESSHKNSGMVEKLLEKEWKAGLSEISAYRNFAEKVKQKKYDLLETLIRIKKDGKCIVGYGAAAKANTLLNYCGIKGDFIDYVVDKNPCKQGTFLPGSRIPVYAPEKIAETKPDYIFILPWNIKTEIMEQLSFVREWGGDFLLAIPEIEVIK